VAGRGTTATIALERARIRFTVHEYEHDPRHESYGAEASEALGVAPERVFKTLIADVDGSLVTAVVPVDGELDLKALAAAIGGKRVAMADVTAAERATGYVAGGISPLGQRKRLPVVLDTSALSHATVFCSAGRRGLEIELAPAELARAVNATIAAIRRPRPLPPAGDGPVRQAAVLAGRPGRTNGTKRAGVNRESSSCAVTPAMTGITAHKVSMTPTEA
jgi:Cys-tRNA(Pro)/Cys-tRNA(Cys) deacylase